MGKVVKEYLTAFFTVLTLANTRQQYETSVWLPKRGNILFSPKRCNKVCFRSTACMERISKIVYAFLAFANVECVLWNHCSHHSDNERFVRLIFNSSEGRQQRSVGVPLESCDIANV